MIWLHVSWLQQPLMVSLLRKCWIMFFLNSEMLSHLTLICIWIKQMTLLNGIRVSLSISLKKSGNNGRILRMPILTTKWRLNSIKSRMFSSIISTKSWSEVRNLKNCRRRPMKLELQVIRLRRSQRNWIKASGTISNVDAVVPLITIEDSCQERYRLSRLPSKQMT